MSFEKFEANLNCVGGRHQSATISVEGDPFKTVQTFLNGKCVQRNKKITDW